MRTWARADRDMLCGFCEHSPIAVGDPILVIAFSTVKRQFVRCKHCAGPVPPDLPARIERLPIDATPFVRFTPGMLPLDFKARAAGREPGEEG